ncbi:MAG: helix-turn-helix domain-containing protein [Motiliproteus sp.]
MNINNKNWPQIYTIGDECIERFINSRDADSPLENHDIIAAGLSDLKGNYDLSRRFDAHIVNFTVGGMGRLITPDYQRIMGPGDLMLIPAGSPARYHLHGDSWKTMWFDLADVERWSWLRDQGVTTHKAKNIDALYAAMDALYHETHSHEQESRALANLLLEQVDIYLKRELEFEVDDYEKHIKDRLTNLFEVVKRQLQHPWNVDKLAEIATVSPSHLYTLCREHLGINPMKQVTQLRMQRARMLLYQTNASVAQIAGMVGYQNQFNFSSAFKKHSGSSPTNYRKKLRDSGVF